MCNWITHARIADILLERHPSLHARGFAIGSIAPDCNVENEDWTAFTPAREVTHWMKDKRKRTEDYLDFFARYYDGRVFPDSSEEKSFLLGYAAHLIADAEYQIFFRSEAHVQSMYDRIKKVPDMADRLTGLPETFDSLKKAFTKWVVFGDVADWEEKYVLAHPDSCYHTLIRTLTAYPDYLDYLPTGAIVRKIPLLGPNVTENTHDGACHLFFTQEDYEGFIERTCDRIEKRLL